MLVLSLPESEGQEYGPHKAFGLAGGLLLAQTTVPPARGVVVGGVAGVVGGGATVVGGRTAVL